MSPTQPIQPRDALNRLLKIYQDRVADVECQEAIDLIQNACDLPGGSNCAGGTVVIDRLLSSHEGRLYIKVLGWLSHFKWEADSDENPWRGDNGERLELGRRDRWIVIIQQALAEDYY